MPAQMLLTVPDNGQFTHSTDPLTLYQVVPYQRHLETINLPVMKIATRTTERAAWVNLTTPLGARFHANVMVVPVPNPPSMKLATVPPIDMPPLPEGQIYGIPNAVPIPTPSDATTTTATTAAQRAGGGPGIGQYTPTPSPPAIPPIKAAILKKKGK